LPLIRVLCNKALRPRHWIKLNEFAGKDITPNAGTRLVFGILVTDLKLSENCVTQQIFCFSLRKVVATDLSHAMAALEVVSIGASREHTLEKHLADMKEKWKVFRLRPVT